MAIGGRPDRRILHTSDLHLETPGDKACRSLEALVGLAASTGVDMVIIAGDLFDHNRVDDSLVSFAAGQLKRLAMPVVILPGNHDCLVPGCAFDRPGFWDGLANVRVFRALDGETLDLPGLAISVWGKPIGSYKADDRPLAGVPRPGGNGRWHIAVAHGSYIDSDPPIFPSLHITPEEIGASGQDYIALGHWPNFRCVCSEPVKAYYCDSPSWGFPKSTVNLVDLVDGMPVKVSRYSLENGEEAKS